MASVSCQLAADRPRANGMVSFVAVAAVALYTVSFFVPATNHHLLGYQAFFYALLAVSTIPMWSANVLFWIGLTMLCGPRFEKAWALGLVALGLGLSESWMFWDELSVGYFLWIGSMAMLASSGAFRMRIADSREVGTMAAEQALERRDPEDR
jgi:hypothetical protein